HSGEPNSGAPNSGAPCHAGQCRSAYLVAPVSDSEPGVHTLDQGAPGREVWIPGSRAAHIAGTIFILPRLRPRGAQVRQMRVLVLVPTTGKLNRVLRIDPYPDLVHSFVVRQGDVERLPITRKYADLTSEGGPLAALGSPVKPGLYRLLLAGPIDGGDSWQLPV